VSRQAESAAILFDWGETLVSIPGMLHSAERHMACLRRLYVERREDGGPSLADSCGVPWEAFQRTYWDAAQAQIARSAQTCREHTFEDRLADTFCRLDAPHALGEAELASLVVRLGHYFVDDASAVEGAIEVVPLLAERYRLGVVSNYPSAPLVARTLERFGILRFFSAVVVSGEFGWLKPHPSIFREALSRLGAQAERALFVGDDLRNDVKGPKALGFRTAWFTPGRPPTDDPDVDVQLGDLRDLPQWCRTHFAHQ
jgi:putative hydrolase of the HAD superfamily